MDVIVDRVLVDWHVHVDSADTDLLLDVFVLDHVLVEWSKVDLVAMIGSSLLDALLF